MRNCIIALMALLCLNQSNAQISPCESNSRNIYGVCLELQEKDNDEFVGEFSETHLAHQEVHFYVTQEFPLQGNNVSIDFGNGTGFIPYSSITMSPRVIQYSTSGTKTLTFRNERPNETIIWTEEIKILDNGNFTYTAPDEIWELETSVYTPPCSNAFASDNPYASPGKAKGRAYIKYANPSDPVIRNPVVFVEGFDFFDEAYYDPATNEVVRFGRIGWDVMTRGLSNGEGEQIFKQMPIQISDFQANNYDLIYLDMEDGKDYIQRSALLVQELLEEINTVKDCSAEETLIIGASMGGQVVRFALTQMENEGRYHGVRTYVSFDAPHQGAVVPMGIQATIWGLAHLSANIDDNVDKLWKALDSPAARQMLYETFLSAVNNGDVTYNLNELDLDFTNANLSPLPASLNAKTLGDFIDMNLDYDCLRNDFVNERSNLGYPKQARNVAIANGNKKAISQAFNQTDELVNLEVNKYNLTFFNLEIRPAPNTQMVDLDLPSQNQSILGQTIPSAMHLFSVNSTTLTPYDIAPGSMQTFTKILADELKKQDGMSIITPTNETHCFMPTISTLDINTNDLNFHIGNGNILNTGLTPFVNFHAPDDNEHHVQITAGNRAFINGEVAINQSELNGVTLVANESYNFGGSSQYLNNFTIGSGAVVGVNRPQELGFSGSGNPLPSGHLTAFVGKCGITVADGGLLEVGGFSSERANLYIPEGSTLRIEKGGKIIIHSYSKIIVEEGGALIIEDGGEINYWGSGTPNANAIVINGDFIVEDNGGNVASIYGSGRIIANETAQIDIQDNAHLTLNGQTSNNTILELKPNAEFGVSSAGRLDIYNGDVDYGDNSTVYARTGGELRMNNVNLNGDLGITGIEADDAYRVIVQNVVFNDLGDGIQVLNGSTNATMNYSINSCTFNNCITGIWAEKTISLKSNGNIFNGNSIGSSAIIAIEVELLQINSNTIQDYVGNGIHLDGVPVCQIKNTTISNCNVGIHGKVLQLTQGAKGTNVLLSHGTVVSDNFIGVELYGDSESGLLSMNCATLDNNGTGVLGTDVVLDIDAEIHAYGQNYINPNSFKNFSDIKPLFVICYDKRDIDVILAKNNYWDGASPWLVHNRYSIYNSGGNGCSLPGISNVTLDLANYTLTEPQGCNYQNTTATDEGDPNANATIMMTANQCSLAVNGQTYAVETQYRLGDEKFKEEEFEDADLKYAPISALDGPIRDGSSDICRHYIDIAHIMVKVEEILNNQKSGRSANILDLWDDAAKIVDETQRIATLNAFPNPATDVLTIRIMDNIDGRGFIKLYNALGQEVYNNTPNGNIIEIPVEQLTAGLYRAEWINENGNWSGTTKVVVQ